MTTGSETLSPTAQLHVVNRPTDEPHTIGAEQGPNPTTKPAADGEKVAAKTSGADEPAVIDDVPAPSREITLLGGKLKLDTYKEAVLGSPDAKYIVVELMDYTCPHCRKMQPHIREALHRYGDQLAVVILPVPLELECNKLVPETDPIHRGSCKISEVALAVAKVDPSKFVDFHNYLLADEKNVPSPTQSVMRAFRLVDRQEFGKVSHSRETEDRIQQNIRLFATLSAQHRGDEKFGLPVQILGDTVLTGGDLSVEELFEAWEKRSASSRCRRPGGGPNERTNRSGSFS